VESVLVKTLTIEIWRLKAVLRSKSDNLWTFLLPKTAKDWLNIWRVNSTKQKWKIQSDFMCQKESKSWLAKTCWISSSVRQTIVLFCSRGRTHARTHARTPRVNAPPSVNVPPSVNAPPNVNAQPSVNATPNADTNLSSIFDQRHLPIRIYWLPPLWCST
jgi:hypothetical protein